jgi:transposase
VAEPVAAELWDQLPADLPDLLSLLPQADLYLQDEVQVAFHPTLTRVWSRRGRRGQRRVAAPGANEKVYGFGLVDWRDGWFDGRIGPQRTAALFCEQLEAAVARSTKRGRLALVLADNLRTHTAAGSRRVRELLAAEQGHLVLVYTPAYDPDANRIEWLWRILRAAVTHNHRRATFALLLADLEAEFDRFRREPKAVLAHIGSPGGTSPPTPTLANAA